MQLATLTPTAALPAGYTARPATLADAPAVAVMLNASSRALLGVEQHKAEELEQDWQNPIYHLETDSQMILAPDGTVAGYTTVWDESPHVQPENWGHVHPAHRGRGLGTYLVTWAEARAAQAVPLAPPSVRVIVTSWINSLDATSKDLLRTFGQQHVRSAWRMVIDLDAPPPAPMLPAGVRLRTFVLGQDDEATVHTVRACFADHWGHVERPFEEELEGWRHNWATNPNFDASLWSLAVTDTPDGESVIGTSFARLHLNEDPGMGWIFSLGVRREWRRQGLAQALLLDSFGRLYARGQRRVGLGVDSGSLTGATRLYEKAGMRADPRYTYEVWEKELRPGADLATTALDAH